MVQSTASEIVSNRRLLLWFTYIVKMDVFMVIVFVFLFIQTQTMVSVDAHHIERVTPTFGYIIKEVLDNGFKNSYGKTCFVKIAKDQNYVSSTNL